MKNIYALVFLCPSLVLAAPVAIETSKFSNSKDSSFAIGFTRSIAKRPFIGVDDQSTSLPYISWRYKDFQIEGVSASYTLSHNHDFKTAVLITPRFYEVKPSFASAGELNGLDETRQTLLVGISTQFVIKPAVFTVQLLSDAIESKGLEFVASMSRRLVLNPSLSLFPSVGLSWQDADMVDHFYGVQENEVQVGRALYKGSATLNYNASMTLSWQVTPKIEMLGFIKYQALGEGITDSSIVDEDDIVLAALGAVYRF